MPSLAPISIAGDAANESAASRLDRWKRRLLDLSLRNRLLNFRPSRSTVRILYPDLTELQRALDEGKELSILSLHHEAAAGGAEPVIQTEGGERFVVGAVLRDDLKAGRLRTDLVPPELSKCLTHDIQEIAQQHRRRRGRTPSISPWGS